MKIYLVGGAVRDKLLGLPVKERDWVVVGATPAEMLARGFRQVGRDFPVFLHPETHEEYALARTERKTGKGYVQFKCNADPSVTLEEDLLRRDLTINAIAMTEDDKLIDPYGGAEDLKKHLLKHVSKAFAEDPVRILRVARFAARFCDFSVHPETNKLMHAMLKAGEVDALVAERVWQELSKGLAEPCPERFFLVLEDCEVLPKLFPEIIPQLPDTLAALQKSVRLNASLQVRFAVLLNNLTSDVVKKFCHRLRVPKAYLDLAVLLAKFKQDYYKACDLFAEDLLTLLEKIDAFRRAKRFTDFLRACSACTKKNLDHEYKILDIAYKAAIKITGAELLKESPDTKNIRELLHNARIKSIAETLRINSQRKGAK